MRWKVVFVGVCVGAGLLFVTNIDSRADLVTQSKLLLAGNLYTQQSAEQAEGGAKKKLKGRLPNNYGKIGITSDQRQKIYEIQAKYREQVAELQVQILKLRKQRDGEVHGVLTDTQKKQLEELQAKSSKKTPPEE